MSAERRAFLKTIITSLVSALVGGLLAVLFVLIGLNGLSGLDQETGGVTITESTPPVAPQKAGSGNGAGPSVQEIYTRDGPGVVSVSVASEAGVAGGSGFVLDESGYIVTNQHVIDGAEDVTVRFSSGARMEAEIVGEDPSTDLAVLKVEAPEGSLKPLTLGDSDSVEVGEPVIAIGNPLDVGISVTTGIVSGLGRPIKAPNNYTIDGAVQTDAAINPGNSGGPLLDSRGRVIGVNSQIISDTGSFQGVGFAVPINTVKNVVEQLISTGEVEHGFIGVRMFPAGVEEVAAYTGLSAGDLRDEYGLPENGAIVSEVAQGGPADEAGISGGDVEEIDGLQVPLGDVITQARGEPVSTPDDVIKIVNSLKPGDRLRLTVVTPGEESRQAEITLGVQPEST